LSDGGKVNHSSRPIERAVERGSSRPESLLVSDTDRAPMRLVPELDLDFSRPNLVSEPQAPELLIITRLSLIASQRH
jgi:hypothetical protein